MTKAEVASKALSWAAFFAVGGSVYGVLLALGIVGLIFYNKWNFRKMKEDREAEDEYFAELYGQEKARGSLHSWDDSFYGKYGGRRGPDSTMSDSAMDHDTRLEPGDIDPAVPQSVAPAIGMRGRLRESSQTISTLGEGGDMADERHSWQKGPAPPPPPLQPPPHGKGGRRSSSLASIESWEA